MTVENYKAERAAHPIPATVAAAKRRIRHCESCGAGGRPLDHTTYRLMDVRGSVANEWRLLAAARASLADPGRHPMWNSQWRLCGRATAVCGGAPPSPTFQGRREAPGARRKISGIGVRYGKTYYMVPRWGGGCSDAQANCNSSQDKFDEICVLLAQGRKLREIARMANMPTASTSGVGRKIGPKDAEQYPARERQGYDLMAEDSARHR